MHIRPTPLLPRRPLLLAPYRTIYSSFPEHPLHITPAHPAHGLADLRLVNEWDPVLQASVPHDVWVEHMRAIEGEVVITATAANAGEAAQAGPGGRQVLGGRERVEGERDEKRAFDRTPTV